MMSLIQSVDTGILLDLVALRSELLTTFFLLCTHIGDATSIACIAAISVAWLVLEKRYADAAGLIGAVTTATGLILMLKYVVNRMRPDALYQVYAEGPLHSFPSAHAGLSMALYGYLLYLIMQNYWNPTRRMLTVLLPLIIFVVGFSRLYLGVHFLSDVLVGYLIGALCVWIGKTIRLYSLR